MRTNVKVGPPLRYPGTDAEAPLPHALANLILAIGRKDFEQHLVAIVAKEFSARELLITRSGKNGHVELLFRHCPGELLLSEPYETTPQIVVARLGSVRPVRPVPHPNERVLETPLSLQRWSCHGDNIAVVRTLGAFNIVSRTGEHALCVELRRNPALGPFDPRQIRTLHDNCMIIAAAVERHYLFDAVRPNSCTLESMIEAFVRDTIGESPLSKREAETCGRIVLGYSLEAIALDLRISKHSAATYRRRAFAKLRIATSKELFGIVLRFLWHPHQSSTSK